MSNEVKSIRIVDPHTISIVERWSKRFNGVPATKAASKMIERLDALESQTNDGSGSKAGTDADKDIAASAPGH